MSELIIAKDLKPTIYKSKGHIKGNILYFHGGGLLFGTKEDLPQYHIDKITEGGYNIYSFNYPLAPETRLPKILEYIINLINSYGRDNEKTPYFLWGRSAGAYLSLLAPFSKLDKKPNGIISYYGYGFLTPDWYNKPNNYYLKYPVLNEDMVKNLIQDKKVYSYPAYPRFLLYLYTRQRGNWPEYIWDGSTEELINEYGLRNKNFNNYPPTFLAHGIGDPDVPFEESKELSKIIKNNEVHLFSTNEHDFDKDIKNKNTRDLLDKTIVFLNRNI